MGDKIAAILDTVVGVEGGYVNNPADRGGPTKFGITQAEARVSGYTGDMRSLPRELALSIFRRKYVVQPHFDQVATISIDVAAELIDTYINMGGGNADTKDGPIFWLQRLLNAFNQQAKAYPDIAVDGVIGNGVLGALKSFVHLRGDKVLVTALNCMQGARYLKLAEANPTQETFAYGWFANRVILGAPPAPAPVSKVQTLLGGTTMSDSITIPEALATEPPPVPTLVTFAGGALAKFIKARFGETTTWVGVALFILTLIMNPAVFDQLRQALQAFQNHTSTGVFSALFSILLVVLKERGATK